MRLSSCHPRMIFNYAKTPSADPEVELIGEDGGNKLASVGSNLNLTCFIRQMPDETKALRWTHGDEVRLNLNLI